MKIASFTPGLAIASTFLCVVVILRFTSPAMASEERANPIESLVAVTPESLASLRVPARVETVAPQPVETDQGVVDLNIDGMSDQGSVPLTLWKAFPTVPLCQEWAPSGESPRFPFAVEANERLVDALDKLRENSDGFMDWALLHGRIVVTAKAPASEVMDRTVRVDVTAETLQEALEQVEAAYNERYSDVPVLVRPTPPRLMLKTRPDVQARTALFELQTEGSLREVVLTILEQMEDPAICYGLAEVTDSKERHYFALHTTKRDAPDLDTYANNEESLLHDRMLEDCNQRLDAYLAANAEHAAKAADSNAEDETAP